MVVGITGTIGAGKDTLMELLVNEFGFKHFSVRNMLTDILEEEGEEVNRDNMTKLANRLREQHHPAYFAEELFNQAVQCGGNAVIESIRTVGEIDFLRKHAQFTLLAVDADPNLRYERVQQRKSLTDRIDFNTFMSDEQREMTNTDPNMQNLDACIRLADYRFKNNSSVELFYKRARRVLKEKLHIKPATCC